MTTKPASTELGGRYEESRSRRRKVLGSAIKTLRGDGITQTDLGLLLASSQADGIPVLQTTISRWEAGGVELTLEQAYAVEEALNARHGTLATSAGYVDTNQSYKDIEELLRADSNLHPEFREDFVRMYRSYIKTSKKLMASETAQTHQERARRA